MKKKSKLVSFILAFFFSFFTFLYTYKKDKTLFWILGIICILSIYFQLILPIWIISMFFVLTESKDFYKNYYKEVK